MARKADPRVKHAALEVLAYHYDSSTELLRSNREVIDGVIDPGEYGHDDPEEFLAAINNYIEAILEGEFEQRTSTR